MKTSVNILLEFSAITRKDTFFPIKIRVLQYFSSGVPVHIQHWIDINFGLRINAFTINGMANYCLFFPQKWCVKEKIVIEIHVKNNFVYFEKN